MLTRVQKSDPGLKNPTPGVNKKKMRAEKPCVTPHSELQTEPYSASCGQKTCWVVPVKISVYLKGQILFSNKEILFSKKEILLPKREILLPTKEILFSNRGNPVSKKGHPVVKKVNPVYKKGNPVFNKGNPVFKKGNPVFKKGTPAVCAEDKSAVSA